MNDQNVNEEDKDFDRLLERMDSMQFDAKSDETWRKEMEERDRAARIAGMRERWNIPLRQSHNVDLNSGGEWGKVNEKLKGLLGSGFLIAMTGNRGTGKTQLAVSLMFHSTDQERSALYRTTTEFFMAIKAAFRAHAEVSEEQVVNDHCKPKLLVLDEFGRRGETEWEDRMLFEVLDRRYRAMKDTLLISNQDKTGFQASAGPSLISRMQETGGIIDCTWKSFREKTA